jgi:hypothetical protein
MSGNKAHDSEGEDSRYCGAKTRSGGSCKRPAGWGTDHVGTGRCKLHGGKSTGAKSIEGKQKVSQNAKKHGAYIDRIINDEEQMTYDWLFAETVKKYDLDEENPIHMITLQRACITYIKLIRLDEWEMNEEYVHNELQKNPKTGYMEPSPEPIYSEEGELIGIKHGETRRLRWAKNAPSWETHFQNYIKLLGVDRATEQKMKADGETAGKVIDTFGWLWGKQQEETS